MIYLFVVFLICRLIVSIKNKLLLLLLFAVQHDQVNIIIVVVVGCLLHCKL